MTLFPQRPLLLSLACCLTLTACEDDRIHNICSQNPALCADLVDDGWCRYERSDVIRARYYLQTEETDRRKYELMRGLERYLHCAEHSTNIEYKRAREQKSPRVEGMLAAGSQLEQLDAQTRGSRDPYLLLWHWTNNTNPQARASFMALEGTPTLEEPELQLALGGIYAKHEPQKAIALMHHALSLYREGEQVNSRILTALSTLYMGQKGFEQAYLWGKVSESFQEQQEVSSVRLGIYHAIGKAEQERLDEQAAVIVDALKQGTYRTP
ncbi:DUF2989 domain-containing protein [Aeromonas taiwanensis]|uniref:DUF2989 domain-containing protein n=1 Tax=Aeromonas taiwanensis TaxID=633417 RepID=UPI00207C2CCC|nr:DUF2989 domain-containing protein [Aeromonas taiwanensis]MCO4205462.1 DUF2989 domain-containing protein [Aeromonas taiwanensis]